MEKEMANKKMPVLFLGHGSPMNALADNDFTRTLKRLGQEIPRPKAILCVSAHWMSEGTWITGMEKPRTIHDFYGFPQSLFDVQYPALGNPELAESIRAAAFPSKINLDHEMWGYDHGAWSVLKHMYPEANVPVLQLSIYMERTADYHFKVGQDIARLREQGILIVGSGNIVHNLSKLNWDKEAKPHDWAIEFDEWAKDKLIKRDFKALQFDIANSEAARLAVPTPDHYYPLLYILGASHASDEMKFEYEEIQNASISMRCVSFGL